MLNNLQKKLRLRILELAYKTNSAHPHLGSCLSCIDILIVTFIFEMNPRDKFVFSKGHASLALYVVLNHLKKISNNSLNTYFDDGTIFGIHPPSQLPRDIPLATGSLGHGLSFSCGMAYGYKLKKQKSRVFCLISDGECNEGAVWEAAQFASRYQLGNLIVLIDKNNFQAFGRTSEVLGDGASAAKWRAFGFEVFTCDGHSLKDLEKTFLKIQKIKNNKPRMIICNTLRAKGINEIQNKLISNYTSVDEEIYKRAIEDINNL